LAIKELGNEESKAVDFSEPLPSQRERDQGLELLLMRNMDEALETLSLLVYLIPDLSSARSNPKVESTVKLLFDVLQTLIYKVDPWFVELILLRYHEAGLLREHLGATGETLYQITEEFVISNWSLFGDAFRFRYREEMYEE
jgi:hypothetical protein